MSEYALDEAQGRLPKIVSAVEKGERVIMTGDGEPAVQRVRCEHKRRGGFDWDRLDANRRRLGIKDAPPEEAEAMMAALHDAVLSRRVLGLDEDG